MGNQISTQSFQELHLQDLGQGLAQEKILGNGRLLKSVLCYTETGQLNVVKVYLKKPDDSQLVLTNFENILKTYNEKISIKEQSNLLLYHQIIQTEKAGYLVRQYFYSNLSDRLNTRPFFTDFSKKWICFQILKGLNQMHSINIFHGDLKCENILLTGYDWCFISDLSPYKKKYLPLDDPADFYYFYDTTGKTTCLIAPERFIKKDSKEEYGISEITSDIFSAGCLFAQLFLDGTALFDLSQLLQYRNGDSSHLKSQLEKIQIKEIREMIQNMLELDPNKRNISNYYLENEIFPKYFESFHNLIKDLILLDSDSRVTKICDSFNDILKMINKSYEGLDIISSILCSSFRNAKDINIRIRGLNFIQKISELCTDYTKYQRLIPYTYYMISDTSPFVRSNAIKTLSFILNKIESFQLGETNLFNDYILPRFKSLTHDSSEIVRITFSEHLPFIAYQSRKLLEMNQLKSTIDENTSNIKSNYDTDLNNLHDEFSFLVLQISMDPVTGVKRALLKNIMKLALFYGKKKTCDFLLPMLITFINSREWLLRYSFFEKISEISIFVGPLALKEYILPCISSALYDVEEFVIHQALNGLVSCIEIGYIKKNDLIDLSIQIAPMLHHPNVWIRYSSISFFSSISKYLGFIENSSFILPILKKHLNYDILMINESSLLQTVKPSISRISFDKLLKLGELLDKKQFPISLNQEEYDLFLLMKNYLIISSKIMDSKLWDSKSASEPIPTLINLEDLKKKRKISKSLIQPKIKKQFNQLLTYSNEHKKGVNEICVSEDSNYFISCSNDCSLKVYNLDKLDNEFILKSKLTCTINTIVSNSINSCSIYSNKMTGVSDSGLLYIFDINKGQTDSIYQCLNSKLNYLEKEPNNKLENISSLNCIKTINNLLITGNQNGIIMGIDPRSKKEAFIWDNSNINGPISSLYCENQWMITGTSRGYLSLFDLRYKIKVESLKVSNFKINKFGCFYQNSIPYIYVMNDSNIIYQTCLENLKITKQFKIESNFNSNFNSDYYGIKELENLDQKDYISFNSCFTFQDGNFISGSSDKKIRFWNTSNIDQSYCLIGKSNNELYNYSKNNDILEEKIQKIENSTRKLGLSSSMPLGHLDTITDLNYISCNNISSLISSSKDGSIKIWY